MSLNSGGCIHPPRGWKSRSSGSPSRLPSCSFGATTTFSAPGARTSSAATRKSAGPIAVSPTAIDGGMNVRRSMPCAAALRSAALTSTGSDTPTGRERNP